MPVAWSSVEYLMKVLYMWHLSDKIGNVHVPYRLTNRLESHIFGIPAHYLPITYDEAPITGSMLMQYCVNGNTSSQWEGSNFDPLLNWNLWTDCKNSTTIIFARRLHVKFASIHSILLFAVPQTTTAATNSFNARLVLAKWLARKTPPKAPLCGKEISKKLRPKSVYAFRFSVLFCCLLCDCLVPWPYTIYFILLWHDIDCLCWKCH